MIKPAEIAKNKLENDPDLLWNTFVKFITKADTTEMNDVQMAAQLPFWYDFEVVSGGHLQYFEYMYRKLGDKLNILIMATLDALKIIGANSQTEILGRAADVYFCKPRTHTQDPDEFAQIALEGEFEKFDNDYYQCSPAINDLLAKYLKEHIDSFIKIV